MKRILISLIFSLILLNLSSQNLIVAAYAENKSENQAYLNKELQEYFKQELMTFHSIMEYITQKDYKKIYKVLSAPSFSNGWTKEGVKEEVDWACEIIKKSGLPIDDSIYLNCSHPISWIKTKNPNSSGHRVTFKYSFEVENSKNHNEISLTFIENENSYEIFDLSFSKAEKTDLLMMLINNVGNSIFAHTLDSALNSDPNDVKKITLVESEFSKFEKEFIERFPKLIELRINHQKINTMPSFIRNMNYIEVIDVSENELSSLPSWISELTNLRELNAAYNKITEVPNELFDLDSLEKLELHWNSLSDKERAKIEKKFKNIDLSISQQ